MKAARSFEAQITRWLEEEAVGSLPDRVLDHALQRTRATRQAGQLWRSPSVSPARLALIVAGAVVIVIGVGTWLALPRGGTVGGPRASAGPSLSPPPAGFPSFAAHFRSAWYGYTIEYPAGWTALNGGGPWPLGTNLLHNDPHLDVIRGRFGEREARFVAASVALPAGATIDEFRSWASLGRCQALDPLPVPFKVDGVDSLVSQNGCQSLSDLGGLLYDVLVIVGGRGYDFTIDGDVDAVDASTWLGSIALMPDSAPVPSPAAAIGPAQIETSSWTAFTSARNGISFRVPPGWQINASTEPWSWRRDDPGPSPWALDSATAPDGSGFIAGSQKLPPDIDGAAWWAAYLGHVSQWYGGTNCFPSSPTGYATTLVAGQTAYIDTGGTCGIMSTIVIVGDRAYLLEAWGNLEKIPFSRSVDPALFNAWLATVHFDPAAAVDTPVASPSPS